MKFNIHGKKMEVTEPIKNYIENKIGRLDKYFDKPEDITATIVVRVRGIEQIVEVTIPTQTVILRGEEILNLILILMLNLVKKIN